MTKNQIYINGTAVVISGIELDFYSVIQFCEMCNIDVPRYCYHDQLSISGNCRICLVEVDGGTKPFVSCATEVSAEMSIVTNSALVVEAREYVLEFLLLNHPLDCPICDQGGECDLQDIERSFGSDRSRFTQIKRSVSDKYFGSLVKTVMTRCIHCTRCVRFYDEIAAVPYIGTLGRGSSSELDLFSYYPVVSEVLGNVIDLCPVGALTSKPYAFTARSWELVSTESIDILDSLCSNIRIETRGSELMRILPRLNHFVNDEWITDKIRFSANGFKRQRLLSPFLSSDAGILSACSWRTAFRFFRAQFLKLNAINEAYFFAGHLVDCVSFHFFRYFCNILGISHVNVHIESSTDLRLSYLVSNSFSELIEESCVFLLLGINLKLESPILNIRLKKLSFDSISSIRIGYIGTRIFSNYPILHLGFGSASVSMLFFGRSSFCYDLQKVVCFSGQSVSTYVNSLLLKLESSVFSTNYISLYSGDINLHELCVLQSYNSRTKFASKRSPAFIYLLGADFLPHLDKTAKIIVYHGHHYIADKDYYHSTRYLFLPSTSFIEREGLFANCQGKYQVAGQATSGSGDALNNERVIFALCKYVGNVHGHFDSYLDISRKYIPFQLNYISDFSVCYALQMQMSSLISYMRSTIYFVLLRSYYETDIISRSNLDFRALQHAYNTAHNYA